MHTPILLCSLQAVSKNWPIQRNPIYLYFNFKGMLLTEQYCKFIDRYPATQGLNSMCDWHYATGRIVGSCFRIRVYSDMSLAKVLRTEQSRDHLKPAPRTHYHFRLLFLYCEETFPPANNSATRLDQVAANFMKSLLLFCSPFFF